MFAPGTTAGAPAAANLGSIGANQIYIVGTDVYQVVDDPDSWTDPVGDDPATNAAADDDDTVDRKIGETGDVNGDAEGNGTVLHWRIAAKEIIEKTPYVPARAAVPAVDAIMARAADQETHWALGGKFDLGVATIGLGYDSDKAIQASVGGSFGQMGGSLYYAQKKDDTDTKHTSLGAQVDVSAGDGTTITAVLAQNEVDGAADKDQGFGLGVKHDLGGGAEVQAGFAQVKDVNKAGVGVVMSF
ncbi:MAG: porin [Rhodobacteraceae bacterium]|nr:porin [Paracoccaceae bacterium]